MLALKMHRLIGHWDPGWLGTVGVFIFFVHTSLVLMWSLERKPHTLDFYIRRVFRIYPLAMLAVTAALVTHAPVMGPPDDFFQYHARDAATVVANYFLLQNLIPGEPGVLNVMWSLPLEVDMYLFLPVLFFFVRKTPRLWPLLLMWLFVVRFSMLKFQDPNELSIVSVAPMFLPGVMAYVGFQRSKPIFPAWTVSLLLAGVILFGIYKPTNRKGWYVNLALGLLLPLFRQIRLPCLVRASHEVAKYSYGVYLSHPFALVLGMYVLRGQSLAVQLGVELVTIVLMSVVTYHWLEEPMIQVGRRVAAFAELRSERADATA